MFGIYLYLPYCFPSDAMLMTGWLAGWLAQPSASGFITAMELCHQRKRVVRISTGSKQFDSILGG